MSGRFVVDVLKVFGAGLGIGYMLGVITGVIFAYRERKGRKP